MNDKQAGSVMIHLDQEKVHQFFQRHAERVQSVMAKLDRRKAEDMAKAWTVIVTN